MSVLGRNSSSKLALDLGIGLFEAAGALEARRRACSLWTRMPSGVRVRRAWPLIGPRRWSSPSGSGRGSEKSNSRTAPGPSSSSWETLTDTIGAHKKGRPEPSGNAEYRPRTAGTSKTQQLATALLGDFVVDVARLRARTCRGRPSGRPGRSVRAASARRGRRTRRLRGECRRPGAGRVPRCPRRAASAVRTRLCSATRSAAWASASRRMRSASAWASAMTWSRSWVNRRAALSSSGMDTRI